MANARSVTSRRIRQHPVLGPLADAPMVRIVVDGQDFEARDGEVVAAVLIANGLRIFRTTSASGEPRGPFCAVGRCPECMMIVDGIPSVRTCLTHVREGMRIETQHGLGEWRLEGE